MTCLPPASAISTPACQVTRTPTIGSLPLVKVGSVQLYVNPTPASFSSPDFAPGWLVPEITDALSKECASKSVLLSPHTVTVKHTFVYKRFMEAF